MVSVCELPYRNDNELLFRDRLGYLLIFEFQKTCRFWCVKCGPHRDLGCSIFCFCKRPWAVSPIISCRWGSSSGLLHPRQSWRIPGCRRNWWTCFLSPLCLPPQSLNGACAQRLSLAGNLKVFFGGQRPSWAQLVKAHEGGSCSNLCLRRSRQVLGGRRFWIQREGHWSSLSLWIRFGKTLFGLWVHWNQQCCQRLQPTIQSRRFTRRGKLDWRRSQLRRQPTSTREDWKRKIPGFCWSGRAHELRQRSHLRRLRPNTWKKIARTPVSFGYGGESRSSLWGRCS